MVIVGSGGPIGQSNQARQWPSLLLNALPKSASTFLAETLEKGLGAQPIKLTVGVFPDDLILFSPLQTFAAGGQIARQHFPASAANLAYLRHFGVRPIIHVRDPRAALASWTHRLANADGGWDELFWYYPSICPPREFLQRDFSWQLQWCFEHHFEVFLRWISEWCAAADRGAIEVLFTTYEDFVRDEHRTLSAILEFSRLDGRFRHPRIAPSAKLLLREGTIDGWRAVAADLAQAATRAIPDDMWRRFRWEP
jgi:hypothetical protein